MNAGARPRFDPERFAFFRRELAGYASAISPGDPSKALRILNPTTMEIAELCTGHATVEEIKRHFAARYGQDPHGPLGSQVDEALLMLSLYDFLSLEEDGSRSEPPPGADGVRRLEEWDFLALRMFLNAGAFPDKPAPPLVHFRHPYTTVEMYSELLLRMRLFHFREHFFALWRDRRIEFLVSAFDERPLKPVASLALVAGLPEVPVNEGVARLFEALEADLRGRVHKLEWRTVSDDAQAAELVPVFEGLGFRLAASLADEFGPGRDELVYTRPLHVPGAPVG
ncbi:MAG TPA: hypothetical protein P5234_04850 [Thermoanaerobaculaceae bacterium]|nr:hypothetical protein [Thermoanaerobaculaceae bacterium]HRS15561.1 hypothetical protein [Thermoanaerobaculaceae bacterium]